MNSPEKVFKILYTKSVKKKKNRVFGRFKVNNSQILVIHAVYICNQHNWNIKKFIIMLCERNVTSEPNNFKKYHRVVFESVKKSFNRRRY